MSQWDICIQKIGVTVKMQIIDIVKETEIKIVNYPMQWTVHMRHEEESVDKVWSMEEFQGFFVTEG